MRQAWEHSHPHREGRRLGEPSSEQRRSGRMTAHRCPA